MTSDFRTAFAKFLARPTPIEGFETLVGIWEDHRACLRLKGAGQYDIPGFGNHVRRSFLGALGKSASPEAQFNQPCSWDPPCAYDVFAQEQFRGPKGDGLPKPFCIFAYADGDDLIIELTVFGLAFTWYAAAVEALALGLRDILPWSKIARRDAITCPAIIGRELTETRGLAVSPCPSQVILTTLSPIDVSNKKEVSCASILSSAVRRVDFLARWQGHALPEAATRELTQAFKEMEFIEDTLTTAPGNYDTPHRGKIARSNKIVSGSVRLTSVTPPVWSALRIMERAQIGRGTVQGLGKIELEVAE